MIQGRTYAIFIFLFDQLNLAHRTSEEITLNLVRSNSLGNGIILLCLYVLSAYVGRMYFEAKNRPVYIIREIFELP